MGIKKTGRRYEDEYTRRYLLLEITELNSLRQVVTATADGAIAAVQAEKYINEHFED